MKPCELCDKSLDKADHSVTTHDMCWELLTERVDNNICTRCGKDPISRFEFLCNSCDLGSKYKDYPSPQ